MEEDYILPNEHTLAYRILAFTGICGELPASLLPRLHPSLWYLNSIIVQLKKAGLLKSYYRDKMRAYRLTKKAKAALLADTPERFSFYLTGNVDTNHLKSEPARRIRLHRFAETYAMMRNAGIEIYRDQKPALFSPEKAAARKVQIRAFYNSKEVKEIGVDAVKIRGSRMVGVLVVPTGAYLTYNGVTFSDEWDCRSESRTKALVIDTLSNQIRHDMVYGLLLSNDLDLLYRLISSADSSRRSFFLLDHFYSRFYYLTHDHYGDVSLSVLSSPKMQTILNRILSQEMRPKSLRFPFEHDAVSPDGRPILFSYLLDIPRLVQFNGALEKHNRNGILICFDYQEAILRQCFGDRIEIQTLNFEKFERRFFEEKA